MNRNICTDMNRGIMIKTLRSVAKTVQVRSMVLVYTAVVLLVGAGCSTTNNADFEFEDLAGTQWIMTSMLIDGQSTLGSAGNFTLNFDADNVGGRTDCNVWSAAYSSAQQGGFSLSMMISSEIACPPTSQEEPYVDLLIRIDEFSSTSENLELSAPGGDRIIYAPPE